MSDEMAGPEEFFAKQSELALKLLAPYERYLKRGPDDALTAAEEIDAVLHQNEMHGHALMYALIELHSRAAAALRNHEEADRHD